jgi:hypothetical protein
MTLIEDDLLSALKELNECLKVITSGQVTTADDMERYYQALTWSERVIKSAESE